MAISYEALEGDVVVIIANAHVVISAVVVDVLASKELLEWHVELDSALVLS